MKKLAKIIGLFIFAGMFVLPAIARSSIQERVEAKLNSNQETFFSAIERGDEAMFVRMMNADYKLLHARDENGRTPLMVACAYAADRNYSKRMPDDRYLGMVQRMLILNEGREANINAQNNEGMTALMAAAASNDADIVMRLLQTKGIDVNVKDKFGRTALFYALDFRNSYRGKSKSEQVKLAEAQRWIVGALLSKGAKANIKDVDGKTPLMLAAEYLAYVAPDGSGSHIKPDERDNLKDLQERRDIISYIVMALHGEHAYL